MSDDEAGAASPSPAPRIYALNALRRPDGRLTIFDVQGSIGSSMSQFAAAYGTVREARDRIWVYLERLATLAAGKRILFLFDPYATAHTAPRDLLRLVSEQAAYAPQAAWIDELKEYRQQHADRRALDTAGLTEVLERLTRRHRIPCGYCDRLELEERHGEQQLLLTNYRRRFRDVGESVFLPPAEVGVLVFSGLYERFPFLLREQAPFPVVNEPLVDLFFECRWLLPALLKGSVEAQKLPRELPIGMGLRAADEVRAFVDDVSPRAGFPRCVSKPNHLGHSIGIEFLTHEEAYALADRQPKRRISRERAAELLAPPVVHQYDELLAYGGKQLDALLHHPEARVEPGDGGAFRYVAPYPYFESTVGLLQEFVDGQPILSRRTGKQHKGYMRIVFFDGRVLGAMYRLVDEPDDGAWRNLLSPDVETFLESVPEEEEALLQEDLSSFFGEVERRFEASVGGEADLRRMRQDWVLSQTRA